MRLKTALVCFAYLLGATAAALAAAAHPNFSGAWELDQSRSHSIPPDMKQTMTVAHDGDKVSVELKLVTAQGERVIIEDEIVNPTPQGGTETVLIARKWMHWPDGTFSIETITERGGNAFNNKRVFVKK